MNLRTFVLLASSVCLTAPAIAQPAGRDAINLSQAIVYNSPQDVASWPATATITKLEMRPNGQYPAGLSFTFTKQDTWPDYTPPGWEGPLEYTVWAVVKINGQWYTSGFIQMWRGRASTGAPILSDFARNWAYDARWGPMQGYQPQPGEQMGFFLTAGNARGVSTPTSVRERTNVVMVSLPANDAGVFTFSSASRWTRGDVDGDGKADIAIYRPSTSQWWGLASSTNYTNYARIGWGMPGDVPVPGDYDGDGKTDIAVYRPSTGGWWILWSSTNYTTYGVYAWGGQNGDIPVPGDYDGDGKTDPAIYRPSTAEWWLLKSTTNFTTWKVRGWGASSDVPVPGDYDGDGITDLAVYRPSTNQWWVLWSSSGDSTYGVRAWGLPGDVPVQADYDGDGKTDLAVYRPSTAGWWILKSSSNFTAYSAYAWGLGGDDVPVPADYDGDGKADVAVYRPSTNSWYILWSSTNYTTYSVYGWGLGGDLPLVPKY